MNEMIIKDNKENVLAKYDSTMLEVIKNTVAKNASDEELYMFLTLANQYGLNPFMKEIWFVKMDKSGKNNAIMTSRDGYVKIAKRNPLFEKLQSEAVYENDIFEIEYSGMDIKNFTHKFAAKDRGKIVGAWAAIKFLGQDPRYIYVSYQEYSRSNQIWNKHKGAMIRKVAEKEICRLNTNISGLLIEDEMSEKYSLENSQLSYEEKIKRVKSVKTDEDVGNNITSTDEDINTKNLLETFCQEVKNEGKPCRKGVLLEYSKNALKQGRINREECKALKKFIMSLPGGEIRLNTVLEGDVLSDVEV